MNFKAWFEQWRRDARTQDAIVAEGLRRMWRWTSATKKIIAGVFLVGLSANFVNQDIGGLLMIVAGMVYIVLDYADYWRRGMNTFIMEDPELVREGWRS